MIYHRIRISTRGICLAVLLLAMGFALVAQDVNYRKLLVRCESEHRNHLQEKAFGRFMQQTFADIGTCVIRKPQEVRFRVLSVASQTSGADQEDAMALLKRTLETTSVVLPNKYALKLYIDFNKEAIDVNYSYDSPLPVSVFEIMRDNDRVFVFLGRENSLNYGRVFVVDGEGHLGNENSAWFRWESSLMDKIVIEYGIVRGR